jgi:hypothetical protein
MWFGKLDLQSLVPDQLALSCVLVCVRLSYLTYPQSKSCCGVSLLLSLLLASAWSG